MGRFVRSRKRGSFGARFIDEGQLYGAEVRLALDPRTNRPAQNYFLRPKHQVGHARTTLDSRADSPEVQST